MATGDVGRFDEAGRLFVQGRDDEMIVSGGENVFPKEVEDTLARHDAVAEAAAVGVEDEKFGQRLRAFVVLEPGQGRRPPTSSRTTSSPTSPATRSRARSSSSTSCRATRPARCSSASSSSNRRRAAERLPRPREPRGGGARQAVQHPHRGEEVALVVEVDVDEIGYETANAPAARGASI